MQQLSIGVLSGFLLVGCGSESHEATVVGQWTTANAPSSYDPDAPPDHIVYEEDGAYTEERGADDIRSGTWNIDGNLLRMSVQCTDCRPTSWAVNFRVSETELVWVWGDKSELPFRRAQ